MIEAPIAKMMVMVLVLVLGSGDDYRTDPMPAAECRRTAQHWRENARRVREKRALRRSEVRSARCEVWRGED